MKSKAIIEGRFEPQFQLRLAAKDGGMMEEAMGRHHLDLPLVTAIAEQMARAAKEYPGLDMSATYLASTPTTAS